MQTNEAVSQQTIQQAVIEKLAWLSLERQKEVLTFAEEMAQAEAKPSKFRALFEKAAQDVPPEAWDEVPSDASSHIDRYLYRNLGKHPTSVSFK
ncbi:MAG: hypothetical protein HYR56_21530 [Acidobacteria bacterium]|nr:hypothetical protein [Acidobacteriota bacterium]MBI3427609.1 hypothetical protein [Acidobacteriota bacterium]